MRGSHIGPLLEAYLQKSGSTIGSFSLAHVKTADNDVFVAFLFNRSGTRYEGLAYLNKQAGPEYTLEYVDSTPIADTPYTFHQIDGDLVDSPNTYVVTAGYVHDPSVRSVQIVYSSGVTIVVLGNDHVYMDVQIGVHVNAVKEVDFLDANNTVVLRRK